MNFNFLILGEYSLFVWPAFIFTLGCFFSLHFKTRKELKKNEEIFLSEFGKFPVAEATAIKVTTKKPLSANSVI